MWAGSVSSIPQYWALCDGSNGTPDLRDRFIFGCGTSGCGASLVSSQRRSACARFFSVQHST
eukprot:11855058-Heterocapsa_arctica.AAC.1